MTWLIICFLGGSEYKFKCDIVETTIYNNPTLSLICYVKQEKVAIVPATSCFAEKKIN